MKILIFVLMFLGSTAFADGSTDHNVVAHLKCSDNTQLIADYTSGSLRVIYQPDLGYAKNYDQSIDIPMSQQELAIPFMDIRLSYGGPSIDFPDRVQNGLSLSPTIIGIDKNHTIFKVNFESIAKTSGYFADSLDSGYVEINLIKNSNIDKKIHEITIDRTKIDPITEQQSHIVKDCYAK